MSPEGNKYIIDTNVFIGAFQDYYSFDIAPSFWDFLIDNFAIGSFILIDKVYDELIRGEDELSDWAKRELSDKITKTTEDEKLLEEYSKIINWAFEQTQFLPKAIDDFADAKKADAWIIATALSKGFVIVTHEVFKREAQKKIPIPNVCRPFEVRYINTFELLREMNFRF